MGCAGPLRLAVSSCGGRSSTSVGSGTVKERELPETDGRGRVPEGSGASPGPGSLCDCPRSACWRRAQSGHAGGWGNQGLSKDPEDVAQQPQTAISFRVPAAAGAPWCGDVGGRRGRRSGNLPPNAPAGTTSPGPLALVLFSKLLPRLPAHHPENSVEAPSVSPGPPCQPPPPSAFPVPELSEVMAAEGLCVGCSSTQTPVLCSEDSLLEPSRLAQPPSISAQISTSLTPSPKKPPLSAQRRGLT